MHKVRITLGPLLSNTLPTVILAAAMPTEKIRKYRDEF
jgi:hypothetical protein